MALQLHSILHSTLASFSAADLEESISHFSIQAVGVATAAIVVLVGLAILLNKRMPSVKPLLFMLIVVVATGTTLAISGATVYLNVKSAAGGPVHWHADIEIWACDNELELRDPQGFLSNKIGSATLHEHNDKRIHLEGVPVSLPDDASLGKFMRVIGGEVSDNSLVVPLNDEGHFEDDHAEMDGDGAAAEYAGQIAPHVLTEKDGKYGKFISGQTCGDETAEVQVFAYKYDRDSKTYKQSKISDPEHYQISGYSEVPPGDCVIMEFAPAKDRTDKLCRQYGVRDAERCEAFGVLPNERKICENKEVL